MKKTVQQRVQFNMNNCAKVKTDKYTYTYTDTVMYVCMHIYENVRKHAFTNENGTHRRT